MTRHALIVANVNQSSCPLKCPGNRCQSHCMRRSLVAYVHVWLHGSHHSSLEGQQAGHQHPFAPCGHCFSKLCMVDSNQNAHFSGGGEIAPCLVTHGTLVDIVTPTVATAKEHLVIQGESAVFSNGDDSCVQDDGCCISPTH